MHWINLLALTILLLSGLQIFNAHPALYWGKSSYNGHPPVLQMYGAQAPNGDTVGITEIFGSAISHDGAIRGIQGCQRHAHRTRFSVLAHHSQ